LITQPPAHSQSPSRLLCVYSILSNLHRARVCVCVFFATPYGQVAELKRTETALRRSLADASAATASAEAAAERCREASAEAAAEAEASTSVAEERLQAEQKEARSLRAALAAAQLDLKRVRRGRHAQPICL